MISEVYVNRNLFSNHFLKNRMSDFKEWNEDNRYEQIFQEIKTLYSKEKIVIEGCTNNEGELERIFVRPILEKLDFKFTVQATIQHSAKQPDYALFKSDEDRKEAFKNQDKPDYYKRAICVADAKAWDKNLDKKEGTIKFSNQNPSYQIDYYLRETGKKWGILTNGRKWRVYFEEESHRLDIYYEVDLIECLKRKSEGFKYFYFFFRKDAFTNGDESFLNRVFNQSIKYSESIGENLEENIYKALLWMAKGYFAVGTNKLDINEETLKKVHGNSLVFLYRLLFVLYVESKGLMGTKIIPRKYKGYDITNFIDTILDEMDNDTLNPIGGLHAYKLNHDIFQLIDQGSKALGIPRSVFWIPAYNGGLFSDEKHPFIAPQEKGGKKIQNKYLAKVIDLLTRITSPEHKGKGRIDYSDLSIRHLGGIYEGLLEYQLKIADEDIVPVKKKGKLVYILLEETKKKKKKYSESEIVRKGNIYLVTDKGERKATGSYYTPDYIVKYIVENTVGSVLDKKLKGCKTPEEKKDAILSTKVLDPAMGSGHFLVEATNFIASRLAEVTESKEEKRDIDLAKREVVKHCVYGVDLNPLAVELAKLSLWLNTLSEDKPLSFLDHHLKVGNSLIGADLYKLDRHPKEKLKEETIERKKQLSLDDVFVEVSRESGKVDIKKEMRQLLQMYKRIIERQEEKPDDIKAQEKIFHDLIEHRFRRRFHALADVHTSYYFGNDFTEEQYHELLRELPPGSKWDEFVKQEWVCNATSSLDNPKEVNLSDKKQFFHWQLEFPEIFFDIESGKDKENPGFDVVLGNPPYDVLAEKEIGYSIEQEKKFFKSRQEYYYAVGNKLNLYRLFTVKGLALTKNKMRFSFIIPMAILGDAQATRTRKWILDNFQIEKIEAFPQKDDPYRRVFFEAKLPTGILIIIKDKPNRKGNVTTHPGRLLEELSKEYKLDQKKIKLLDTYSYSIPLLTEDGWRLCERVFLSKQMKKIGDQYHSYQGEINETSMKNFLSKEPIGPEILRGGVVQRYELLETPKQGEEWNLNLKKYSKEVSDDSRKAHVNSWRIGYQRNSALDNYRRIISTIIPPGNHFFDSISYLLSEKEEMFYLLAILNSNLLEFRFRLTSTNNHVNGYEIEALPLRIISFTTSEYEREVLLEKLKEIHRKERDVIKNIDDLLPKDEEGNFITKEEKSDAVHDFLAFLAEQMIEMNKEKQNKIISFKTDLEGIVDKDTFDKLQRGKQGSTLYKNESFRDYVEEGSGKTHYLEESLAWSKETFKDFVKILGGRIFNLSDIVKIYEKYAFDLRELQEKIQKTDKLIDQIVYKLYGLTDEEICIVEKST